ncbi:methyl-accepting chemotaxis protein Tar [Parachlamydia acanthamoebae UV-7]|uniref:Methyl-accepting chemotaxis protein Tar n=2 Tax=Parachlamydia acanthamoebae TaxID=83552 RepID=F8L1S0_PARAV|nr:methyl-accepting chemotaxis protein [Parachlamydia acanthamoebae]CCB87228.1 methyl-accepting chemotaxis protein Tar [Parachlamydia acanthamoebae UV-7]
MTPPLFQLFKKTSIKTKFFIIFALTLLLMSLSLYYIFKVKNFSNQFIKTEIENIQYNREMSNLLQGLYKHQLLIHRIYNGESFLKDSLKTLQDQISQQFERIKVSPHKPKNLFHVLQQRPYNPSENWLLSIGIEEDWKNLLKIPLEQQPLLNSDLYHEQLIKEIHSLISYANLSQNTSLEIDPKNHYYMRSVMSQLPTIQEQLVKILIYGENAIHAGKLVGTNRLNLLNAIETFRSNLLSSHLYLQNIAVNQTNQSPLNDFYESLRKYLIGSEELLQFAENNIINVNRIAVNPEQFANLGDKTLQKSFQLWNTAAEQIESLLQMHFDHFIKRQNLTILAIILITAFLILVGWITMVQCLDAMHEILEKTYEWIQGESPKEISLDMPEEFAQIGIAFNNLSEKARTQAEKFHTAGIHITTTTNQISAVSKQQEDLLLQQQTASKQITEMIHQLSSNANEFGKMVQDMNNRSEQTAALAHSSHIDLNQMEQTIRELVETTGGIASKLGILNEKAGIITNVITTISKVADQTNLLSLNAAIEAEKAGEHGRSFSVIAREIRRLADQTANATFDIEKMINEMVSAVSAGVMGIDKFSEEIRGSVTQATNLNSQLTKIIENIHQQASAFEKVSRELKNQLNYTNQLQSALHLLGDATQQTSTSLPQFMGFVHNLNQVSAEIKEMMPTNH